MKAYSVIFICWILLCLGACTKEAKQDTPVVVNPNNSETREVLLTLKNQLLLPKATKGEDSPATTKAGDQPIATAAENAISTLDVYAFAADTENGEYSFQERFAYRATPNDKLPAGATQLQLNSTGSDDKETTGLLKLKKGLFVKLYCIANDTKLIDPTSGKAVEAADFIPLTVSGNEDEKQTVATAGKPLESAFASWHTHLLTATTAADTLATPLAMTGAMTTPLDLTDFGSAARVQAGIRLTRLVARYDIINEAGSSRFNIETVSMGNARRGSGLFPIRPYGDMPQAKPDELITTPVRRFYGENANKGNQTGAFYSYPSPIKDNGFLILKGMYKINESESKEVSYRIPFTQQGKDGNQTFLEIANNHRYTIAITAADEYHLDCTLTVADWADDGSIDDFKPDQDTGELDVAIPDGFTGDTKYDPDTRSVSMSLKPGSEFDVTTTATANLIVYKKYVGGLSAQQYDWLEVSEPTVTTKAAAMDYKYTFSLKDGYTLGRYPRAVLRFTNTMNGSETTFFVEAVAVPQADNTPQPGKDNPNSFDAENLQVNLYRITDSKANVRITCPDGTTLESKPDWLDVAIVEQKGAETIYSFTLNNRDVTGVPDEKGIVTFHNNKANELKTDITVQLLDAALKPDFSYPSIDGTKNSYDAPVGDTPGNVNMQISDANNFSIGCKSMQGIEVGMDFDGGPEWLKVSGAAVTKTPSENTELKFTLDNAKLGGAKKATITLKNKVGGKNTVFTVSPVFLAPTVAFVNESSSPTQNTMSGNTIKLYQVTGSKLSIKATALGGTYVKTITGDITVTAEENYDAEKIYVVTWKSGATGSFVIANKSDETKETAAYTVNAPVTTITNANGDVLLTTNNGQSVSNTISSPQGFTASVNWNGGNPWFTMGNNFNAGNQTVKATLINNLSNVTIKTATVTLTNKIDGGQNLTYTIAPDFQAPVVAMISNTANRLEGTTVTMIKNTSNSSLNSTITLRATAIGGTQISVTGGLSVTPVTNSTALATDYVVKVAYNASQSTGTIIFYNKSNTQKQTKLNVTIKNNTVVYPPTNEPAIELTSYWIAPSTSKTNWNDAVTSCPQDWHVPNAWEMQTMLKDDGIDNVKKKYLPDGDYWMNQRGASGKPWYISNWSLQHHLNNGGNSGWPADPSSLLNVRCVKNK